MHTFSKPWMAFSALLVTSDRLERGDSICPSTILISLSALLQPPLNLERDFTTDSFPLDAAFVALLTDTTPDFRRASESVLTLLCIPQCLPILRIHT